MLAAHAAAGPRSIAPMRSNTRPNAPSRLTAAAARGARSTPLAPPRRARAPLARAQARARAVAVVDGRRLVLMAGASG
jgi:hypothetical protein